MTSRHGYQTLLRAAIACFLAVLLCSACGSRRRGIAPEDWASIIHVSVALNKTTREEIVAALGPPRETSAEGGRESMAWTNEKGYIVLLSAEDAPPNVMRVRSRLEARFAGDVVTSLDAR
ncbi:MAG: hypothetical protein LBR80_06415 [Deltaproteobacteria bacterium]|jgi:hypothetical protein|nr:hypothetical protein [Deltaproteobacteria bacterium]